MDGWNLMALYERMRSMGLVASKREFSRTWLGRGETYARDYREDGRMHATVPSAVVARLRERLVAVARLVPQGAAQEIAAEVARIDQASAVHHLLAR